jgi:hypothetical protein
LEIDQKIATGWTSFLDIYAFGSYLDDSEISNTSKRLLELYMYIDKYRQKDAYKGINIKTFSDTIVFAMEARGGDLNSFRRLIDVIASIVKKAAEVGFLYRGAICYGEIIENNYYILGDSYLKAYRTESNFLKGPLIIVLQEDLIKAGVAHNFQTSLRDVEGKKEKKVRAFVLQLDDWESRERIAGDQIRKLSMLSLTDSAVSAHIETWQKVIDNIQAWRDDAANPSD